MPKRTPHPLPLGSTLEAGSGPRLRTPAFFRVSWRIHATNLFSLAGVVASIFGISLLFNSAPEEILAGVIVILVGSLALFLAFPILVWPQDRAFLWRVLAAGVLIRLGLSLTAHTLLPVGFFAPDQFTFQDVGWRTLLYLQGLGPSPRQISGHLEVGYFYWNALLFAVFGNAPVAPKLVNCFVGALTALLAYRIAGGLAGREAALNTAVLTMFFPSLILWSTQNLRDTMVLFLIAAIFYLTLRIRARPSGQLLASLMGGLFLLALFRDYMAIMVVFTLLGAFLISPKQQMVVNVFMGVFLLGAAILAYQGLGLGSGWLESANFEAIQAQREALAFGGTAFRPEADVSSTLRGLQYLPYGLAFFFLAPFPWQIGSMLSLMTLPEMLVWYLLLPLVVVGAVHLLKTRFVPTQPLIIFLALTGSVYALVEGNAGTAYRHRAQLILFMLILAGVGLEVWKEWRRRRRESTGGRRPHMVTRP